MSDVPTIGDEEPVDVVRIKRGPYVMEMNLRRGEDGKLKAGNKAFKQIRPALLGKEFFFRNPNISTEIPEIENSILRSAVIRLKV